jgi:hypothetical protein
VIEAGGSAGVWIAHPASTQQEHELARAMAAARAAEYAAIRAEALAGGGFDEATRASLARRLRAELRRIARRDYFPPPERDLARAAVDTLTADTAAHLTTEAREMRP